jgi:hypothetical protein
VEQLDRRGFLVKAGVGTAAAGALWVAPSVLGIDTAFAGASCLQTGTLDWDTFTTGNTPPATLVSQGAVGSYPALTLSYTLTPVGTPNAQTGNNTVTAGPEGGINQKFYQLRMTPGSAGQGFNLTYTFSQPVYNLKFIILDIDRSQNAWVDIAWITSAAAFTFTSNNNPSYTGNGTAATPWTATGNTAVPNTANNGNANITFAGPVTTFTISYRSGNPNGTEQHIGIADMTWCR